MPKQVDSSSTLFLLFVYVFCKALEINLRVLLLLGKYSTTELYPQPIFFKFLIMCIYVSSGYIHICRMPKETRGKLRHFGVELQAVEPPDLGIGNQTWVLWQSKCS